MIKLIFKGIVNDFISIFFMTYKSKDINTKRLFPKNKLIPILRLQLMHDYLHWYGSIDYCVKLRLVDETLCKKMALIS